MASVTVAKTIGASGVFSTLALWEAGAPANLTTAEKSAAGAFLVAAFTQGENLTFVGSGATGKFLDTDSVGAGTGSYVTYGITTGNPAAGDVVTGATSGATCVLSSSTPMNVGVIWQGQCQNQEFLLTSGLVISGTTTSADAYKELTTASGASFRDNIGSNPLRYDASHGCGIRTTTSIVQMLGGDDNYTRVKNLQFKCLRTDTPVIGSDVVTGSIWENLIVEGADVSYVAYFNNDEIVRNCLFAFSNGSGGACIVETFLGSPSFYNCTFAAADDISTIDSVLHSDFGAGVVTVVNCGLFAGDSSRLVHDGPSTFSFTTCFSDISGVTGVTQTSYAGEFISVDSGNKDYRLKSTAAQINAGTTDSTNAAFDIVGTARPVGSAYDVGCWEGGVVQPTLYVSMGTARW